MTVSNLLRNSYRYTAKKIAKIIVANDFNVSFNPEHPRFNETVQVGFLNKNDECDYANILMSGNRAKKLKCEIHKAKIESLNK